MEPNKRKSHKATKTKRSDDVKEKKKIRLSLPQEAQGNEQLAQPSIITPNAAAAPANKPPQQASRALAVRNKKISGVAPAIISNQTILSYLRNNVLEDCCGSTIDINKAVRNNFGTIEDIRWSNIHQRRLLLEDIILSAPRTEFAILVAEDKTDFRSFYGEIPRPYEKPVMEMKDSMGVSHKYHLYRAVVVTNAVLNEYGQSTTSKRQSADNNVEQDADCSKTVVKIGKEDLKHLLTDVGGGSNVVKFYRFSPEENSIHAYQLKWAEFFNDLDLIQVWGVSPCKQNFRAALKAKTNQEARRKLYNRLARETWGDNQTSQLLFNAYSTMKKAFENKQKSKVTEESSDSRDAVKKYTQYVDSIFETAIQNCFGMYTSLEAPLITQSTMQDITSRFETDLKNTFKSIWTRLGFDKVNAKNGVDLAHRTFPHKRITFWTFVEDTRKRNDKEFKHVAIALACISFSGTNRQTQLLTTYYGITCHKKTCNEALSNMLVCFDKNLHQTLHGNDGSFLIYVFDNVQQGKNRKYQRGGLSNDFFKGTARAFLEPVESDPIVANFEAPTRSVNITYIHQDVPAPAGMPKLERLFNQNDSLAKKTETIMGLLATLGCDSGNYGQRSFPLECEYDFSGARVRCHKELIKLFYTMDTLSTYLSVKREIAFLPDHLKGEFLEKSIHALHSIRKRASNHGLFAMAKQYPLAMAGTWKPCSEPVANLLPLPISSQDETTNKGAGVVLLEGLEMGGLLNRTENGSKTEWKATDSDRTMAVVGDALTLERIKSFQNSIGPETQTNNFRELYSLKREFRKAMSRVVIIPGDLHGLSFHTLDCVFQSHYGSFLQPIQVALSWKKIKGSDVADCFQSAYRLMKIVLGETLRLLHFMHLHYLNADASHDRLPSGILQKPQEYAIFLSESFDRYLHRLVRGTDQILQCLSSFTLIATKVELARASIRNGDSIMAEVSYNEFIPIWLALGKKYADLGLDQIEQNYNTIAFKTLQLIRNNRTRKKYSGKDKNGEHYKHHEVDELMEGMMPHLKKMDLRNDADKKSKLMPVMTKMLKFSEVEFTETTDVENADRKAEGKELLDSFDPLCSKSKTAQPRVQKERELIFELLVLLTNGAEVPGREMPEKLVWELLPSITTVITEQPVDEGDSGDMENAVESIMTSVLSPVDDIESMLNEEDEGAEENEDVDERVSNITVVIGRKETRKSNVRVKKRSKFFFQDLEAEGRKLMLEEEINKKRLREKQRSAREAKALYDDLHEFLSNRDEMEQAVETIVAPTADLSFRKIIQK